MCGVKNQIWHFCLTRQCMWFDLGLKGSAVGTSNIGKKDQLKNVWKELAFDRLKYKASAWRIFSVRIKSKGPR